MRFTAALFFVLTVLLVCASSRASGSECSALFNPTEIPRGAISSARIEDHLITVGTAEFLPLMNSASLVKYVEHGGRPKSGVAPAWSSGSALSQVLSLRGPLGPLGPLGRAYGVFGHGPTYPSYWINQFFSVARQNPVMNFWLDWSTHVARNLTPQRSALSPLKEFGPLYGDFNESVYSVLGTPGFLGALVLGPEGPIGGLQAMGLRGPDEGGRFMDPKTGKIVDSLEMTVAGKKRNYRVFKYQSREFVKRQSDSASLDTAFAVDDHLVPGAKSASYNLTSPDSQLVSFLVIPASEASAGLASSGHALNFNITVRDETGRVLLESTEKSLANFVQLRVSKDAKLQVEVSRQGESVQGRAAYRLLVVGDPYFDLQAEGALDTPHALPMPLR